MIILYLLGIILASIPVILLFTIAPEYNRERITYFIVGFVGASFVGLLLLIINITEFFDKPDSAIARITHGALAAFLEEVIRYPSILLAQIIAFKYIYKEIIKYNSSIDTELSEIKKLEWLKIKDPHGMAIYFGVGWGMVETVYYYYIDTVKEMIRGEEWIFTDHLQAVSYRITAVMAHVALTYLAMIITVNRGFYRFSIFLHMGANVINIIFEYMTPSFEAQMLFVIFSRFALVVIIFYLLTPKARYLTPALLLLILTLMFLLFILLGTLIYLIALLLGTNLFTI